MLKLTRSGISRVEAIVLILIAFLMLALLIPAISRVREDYLSSVCKSRLRSIGVASHNYHSDFRHFPSGYYSAVYSHGNNTTYAEERGPHVGSLALLLPYLQHDMVFTQLCNTAETWPQPSRTAAGTRPLKLDIKTESVPWWKEPGNLLPTSGQARITAFTCPSDDVYDDAVTTGIVSLQIDNGSFAYVTVPNANTLGRTNYVGVAGAAGRFSGAISSRPETTWEEYRRKNLWSNFVGCLHNRSTVSLGHVTVMDNTSNTLLFGETLGSTGIGPRTTAFTWFGAGAMGTAYGLGRGNEPGLDELKPPPLGSLPVPGTTGASWFRFSSRHREGVQFCFCDASVRTLQFRNTTKPDLSNEGINESDWSLLQKLAGYKDGFKSEAKSSYD